MRLTFELGKRSRALLGDVAKQLERLGSIAQYKQGAFKFMFIVPDNQPDVNFAITAPTVLDAEGNAIEAPALTYEIVSDNPDAVALTINADGVSGSAHFGNPGLANINATVKDEGGNLIGSFGAQFTVTTGAPSSIAGGGITFEGLTEA